MVKIFYIDNDKLFYSDLNYWLPDNCSLIRLDPEDIMNPPPMNGESDMVLFNPQFEGFNDEYMKHLFLLCHNIPLITISQLKALPLIAQLIRKGALSFYCKEMDKHYLLELIESVMNSRVCKMGQQRFGINNLAFDEIIGQSPPIWEIKRTIVNYSENIDSILLMGSTGTGKDLIARAISNYNNLPNMLSLNCAAIPEQLLESELFGTEKGAYTDATNKQGIFELVDKGLIFLDEVNELPLSAQAKLLRVLENGRFMHLGGKREIESQFRVISACNSDLYSDLEAGRFRKDLFYRLSKLIIKIPPLKNRLKDILPLSEHFLNKIGSNKTLTPNALGKLLLHDWPGNVRELKSTIERANSFALKNDQIKKENIIFY